MNSSTIERYVECIREGRVDFKLVGYLPSRAVMRNREKPVPTIGITSDVKLCSDTRHHLYLDIDSNLPLNNIVEFVNANYRDYPVVVYRTMKGYHVYVLYPFQWKEILRMLSRAKGIVDPKWLNMQRKRGRIIIRLAGKYDKPDIRIVYVKLCNSDEWSLRYASIFLIWIEHIRSRLWNLVLGSPGLVIDMIKKSPKVPLGDGNHA